MVNGEKLSSIHKKLYNETIKSDVKDKILLASAIKTANKAKKIHARKDESLALLIYLLYKRDKINHKMKKIINYDTMKQAESEKNDELDKFIDKNRKNAKYFYLASSHNDCAEDHKDWQGRLYVDDRAPSEIIDYAKQRNLYTIQYIMGEPVWFITRPNCRHYFVSLSMNDVDNNSIKSLKKKYKTHSIEGDRQYSTPYSEPIEEYSDRLKLLRALDRQHTTQELRNDILKTELLLKKWKNAI